MFQMVPEALRNRWTPGRPPGANWEPGATPNAAESRSDAAVRGRKATDDLLQQVRPRESKGADLCCGPRCRRFDSRHSPFRRTAPCIEKRSLFFLWGSFGLWTCSNDKTPWWSCLAVPVVEPEVRPSRLGHRVESSASQSTFPPWSRACPVVAALPGGARCLPEPASACCGRGGRWWCSKN